MSSWRLLHRVRGEGSLVDDRVVMIALSSVVVVVMMMVCVAVLVQLADMLLAAMESDYWRTVNSEVGQAGRQTGSRPQASKSRLIDLPACLLVWVVTVHSAQGGDRGACYVLGTPQDQHRVQLWQHW